LFRPSSENASAVSVTSRPATVILVLSSTRSLSAATLRLARSASIGSVLVQAEIAQKAARGIKPGHHLLLHLNRPCIRYPARERRHQLSDSSAAFALARPARLWRRRRNSR